MTGEILLHIEGVEVTNYIYAVKANPPITPDFILEYTQMFRNVKMT